MHATFVLTTLITELWKEREQLKYLRGLSLDLHMVYYFIVQYILLHPSLCHLLDVFNAGKVRRSSLKVSNQEWHSTLVCYASTIRRVLVLTFSDMHVFAWDVCHQNFRLLGCNIYFSLSPTLCYPCFFMMEHFQYLPSRHIIIFFNQRPNILAYISWHHRYCVWL